MKFNYSWEIISPRKKRQIGHKNLYRVIFLITLLGLLIFYITTNFNLITKIIIILLVLMAFFLIYYFSNPSDFSEKPPNEKYTINEGGIIKKTEDKEIVYSWNDLKSKKTKILSINKNYNWNIIFDKYGSPGFENSAYSYLELDLVIGKYSPGNDFEYVLDINVPNNKREEIKKLMLDSLA